MREHRLANKADVTNGLCLRRLEMLRNLRRHPCMSKAKTAPWLVLRRDGKAKGDLPRDGKAKGDLPRDGQNKRRLTQRWTKQKAT